MRRSAASLVLLLLSACGGGGPNSPGQVTAPALSGILVSPTGAGTEIGTLFTFTAHGTTGSNTTFNWQFGDGASSSGSSTASHVFQRAGAYTVTVQASNSAGQGSASTSVRTVSLQGVWTGTVTGHTRFPPSRPVPITSFEIRINQSIGATNAELNANWLDNAGCRENRFIRGSVSNPKSVTVGVEQLLCNDGDFYLTGALDDSGNVIAGTCQLGGPNCQFRMTRQ